MMASRFGILGAGREAGRCSKGRNSAIGTPDFSMMYDSPSSTALTIALVCKWSSRTVVRFM
jgi:hypothetical protein